MNEQIGRNRTIFGWNKFRDIVSEILPRPIYVNFFFLQNQYFLTGMNQKEKKKLPSRKTK